MSVLKRLPRTMAGAEFRSIRLEMGLTQTVLADRVGLTLRRIQQIEASDTVSGPATILVQMLRKRVKRPVLTLKKEEIL